MKTLLIFLFLSTLTFAQFNTYDLIVEYEQECYADSSLEHTYNSKDEWGYIRCYKQTGLGSGYSFKLDCDDRSHYTYVHKEPSWDGFREFVKKKYKGLTK